MGLFKRLGLPNRIVPICRSCLPNHVLILTAWTPFLPSLLPRPLGGRLPDETGGAVRT